MKLQATTLWPVAVFTCFSKECCQHFPCGGAGGNGAAACHSFRFLVLKSNVCFHVFNYERTWLLCCLLRHERSGKISDRCRWCRLIYRVHPRALIKSNSLAEARGKNSRMLTIYTLACPGVALVWHAQDGMGGWVGGRALFPGGGGGCALIIMHGRSRVAIDPASHPYSAGAEHVGF